MITVLTFLKFIKKLISLIFFRINIKHMIHLFNLIEFICLKEYFVNIWGMIWRPPSPSELIPMIFIMGLIHLGSEISIYYIEN